ncbi:hypothetical protein AAC03nite_17630 [Alicyclobacillus acidoterrestris]|nr:hypothetical protein AAC03nite_17630 [Alicyclobacillus acidoterrestris]
MSGKHQPNTKRRTNGHTNLQPKQTKWDFHTFSVWCVHHIDLIPQLRRDRLSYNMAMRKHYTTSFKAQVVRELLKEEKTSD